MYQSIVQSILLYSIKSVVPTPAHHQRIDALHFRVLRQIFKIRSSFFHRVLQPSDSPCSNTNLHTLANSHELNIYTPSQLAATRRLQLLGHLLRHESCTEHLVSFMPSHAYRFLRGENLRQGRPRPHWAELVLTEAFRRMQIINNKPPQPSLTCLILSFPLQQLQKYILPMALQSQIGGLMRASIDQCGKQREAGLPGEISLANTPNPIPLAECEHYYTMDDTAQWNSNCATHKRISLSSSPIGYKYAYITYGLPHSFQNHALHWL